MAEKVGFEPTIEFPLYTRSRRAPSTTRTSLHNIYTDKVQSIKSLIQLFSLFILLHSNIIFLLVQWKDFLDFFPEFIDDLK